MRRRLLLFILLGGAAAAFITLAAFQRYAHWKTEHQEPYEESTGQSYQPDRVFPHIGCEVWKTENHELFYAIAVGYADFEPIMPSITYEYTYDIKTGGKLSVNGTPISYTGTKRLLALNPFGELEEIILTDSEAQVVASAAAEKIWETVVLNRLYQFKGESDNGKRVGTWTCLDNQGRKAYEGTYVDGQRDGKWTYYYPSGGMRAEIHYAKGKRQGKWTYFTKEGVQSDALTWNNDLPVERPARQAGLGHTDVLYPNGNSQHTGY